MNLGTNQLEGVSINEEIEIVHGEEEVSALTFAFN